MLGIFTFLPAILAAGAAANAAWNTVTKYRARRDLASAVRKSEVDLTELNDQLDAKNLDAATAVVLRHFAELTPAERREAEAALSQPSPAGRVRYMRSLIACGGISASPSTVE